MQIVSLSGGNGKTERAVIEHVALPHLTSPYKGEEKDRRPFPVPLLCLPVGRQVRRGKGR